MSESKSEGHDEPVATPKRKGVRGLHGPGDGRRQPSRATRRESVKTYFYLFGTLLMYGIGGIGGLALVLVGMFWITGWLVPTIIERAGQRLVVGLFGVLFAVFAGVGIVGFARNPNRTGYPQAQTLGGLFLFALIGIICLVYAFVWAPVNARI